MSLINKMLQDLDARGSQSGSALPPEIKPVLIEERRLPMRQIAIAAGALAAALGVGAVIWYMMKDAAPVQTAAVVPAPAPSATLPPSHAIVTAPMVSLAKKMAPEPVAEAVAPATPPAVVAALEEKPKRSAPPVRPQQAGKPLPRAQGTVRAAPLVVGGREMTSVQRAESQYRRALAALDEGRVNSAMEGLGHTLRLNPRHDGARQTLVSLLIEGGRNDEAMQQLEQGLAIDSAQPALAMLLARLQIERGASGVETLMRSLPGASGNGDYLAFLAAVLQREQRHREAAEQYGAALRTSPEHGVWLMGLGISLQAEQRNGEALAAFQKARASNTLTPPLIVFVDRKIQQLGQ